MKAWTPDIVIYHSPCDDGFAAAWACHQRWPDAIYQPGVYGKLCPDVAGMKVLIVDFSYKRPDLDAMLQVAHSIVILDHHKTAQEDLAPFAVELCGSAQLSPEDIPGMLRDLAELDRPPCIALFDMEKSGARLAWEFCNGSNPAPDLIAYVEDRDLWRFAFDETKAFSLYLRSQPMTYPAWNVVATDLEYDKVGLLDQARAIQVFYDQKLRELVREVRTVPIGGYDVPTVNCSWAFASDVAHQLLEAYPTAPFAACYYDRGDGRRSYSLRSENSRVDVSSVAKANGGGGHRNAAGFEVAIP